MPRPVPNSWLASGGSLASCLCLPSLSPGWTSAADSNCFPLETGLWALGLPPPWLRDPLGDPLPVQLPGPPSLVKLGVRRRMRALKLGKKSLPTSLQCGAPSLGCASSLSSNPGVPAQPTSLPRRGQGSGDAHAIPGS